MFMTTTATYIHYTYIYIMYSGYDSSYYYSSQTATTAATATTAPTAPGTEGTASHDYSAYQQGVSFMIDNN